MNDKKNKVTAIVFAGMSALLFFGGCREGNPSTHTKKEEAGKPTTIIKEASKPSITPRPLLPVDAIFAVYSDDAAVNNSPVCKELQATILNKLNPLFTKSPIKTFDKGAVFGFDSSKTLWMLFTMSDFVVPKTYRDTGTPPDLTLTICAPCTPEKVVASINGFITEVVKWIRTTHPFFELDLLEYDTLDGVAFWQFVIPDFLRDDMPYAPCITFLDGSLILVASSPEVLVSLVALYTGKTPPMNAIAPLSTVLDLPTDTFARVHLPNVRRLVRKHIDINDMDAGVLVRRAIASITTLTVDTRAMPDSGTLAVEAHVTCNFEDTAGDLHDLIVGGRGTLKTFLNTMSPRPELRSLIPWLNKVNIHLAGNTITVAIPVTAEIINSLDLGFLEDHPAFARSSREATRRSGTVERPVSHGKRELLHSNEIERARQNSATDFPYENIKR